MEVQVAVAKVPKYATAESGDTVEMIERPHGGFSFVLVDGQRSGRSAKAISNLVARKAISLLGEGVRDGAAARAAHDYLYAYRGGKVSATLNIVSLDMVSRTIVLSRNSHCPIYVINGAGIRVLDEPSRPVGVHRHTKPVVVELPLVPPLNPPPKGGETMGAPQNRAHREGETPGTLRSSAHWEEETPGAFRSPVHSGGGTPGARHSPAHTGGETPGAGHGPAATEGEKPGTSHSAADVEEDASLISPPSGGGLRGGGTTVVLFTDGVLAAGQRRGESLDVPHILQTLCTATDCNAQSIADHLLAAALALDDGRASDDVSILVLAVRPRPVALATSDLSTAQVRRLVLTAPLRL